MKIPRVCDLFDLSHTIAAPLFEVCEYPHEALSGIKSFILKLGPTLSEDEYYLADEDVWIHKSASIAPSALVCGPAIICAGAEIRHCAYIRGSVIVGEGAVVGNSTEVKNAVLFDGVQAPHFNYVGDSVYGYRAHTGAGAIASNVRSDKRNITVKCDGEVLETGIRKFGAILGDYAEIGCNAVLCPGSIIGKNSIVYPLTRVRGVVPENSILKGDGTIVERK